VNPVPTNREIILRTAELLFAEKGIHGVSLRSINVAAAQRNNAALHYHFGTRENLVHAVVESRSSRIDAERIESLGRMAKEAGPETVRACLDALVSPLAELLNDSPGGASYLVVIRQLIDSPLDHPQPVPGRGDFGVEPEILALMIRELQELPEHLARLRTHQALLHIMHALAQRAQEVLNDAGDTSSVELRRFNEGFVANMLDMLLGGLLAPVSRAALHQRNP
jgi:AcrR family transcriptional regulator